MSTFSPALRNTALRNIKSSKRAGFLTRGLATQSGDDAQPPTALAKLHLADGTTLTGRSFGCHKAIEGEVCRDRYGVWLHRRHSNHDSLAA